MIFLYKPEEVGSYLFLKQVPNKGFNYSVLFLSVIIFTITIIRNIIIINNSDARHQDPSYCSKFPWARVRISPKIIVKFSTRSHKCSQALAYRLKDSNMFI
jgi:hypothetical protein